MRKSLPLEHAIYLVRENNPGGSLIVVLPRRIGIKPGEFVRWKKQGSRITLEVA